MTQSSGLFSWFGRLPIRWRLAIASAGATTLILLTFAVAIGQFTVSRVRSDFANQSAAQFDSLRDRLRYQVDLELENGNAVKDRSVIRLDDGPITRSPGTVVVLRYVDISFRRRVVSTDPKVSLGKPIFSKPTSINGYQVESRKIAVPMVNAEGNRVSGPQQPDVKLSREVVVQIGRSYARLDSTIAKIRTALLFGVIAGAGLALAAGYALGRRVMRPVRRMTSAARAIARTRKLDIPMPPSGANDEIEDLSRTLQDMLSELRAANHRADETLQRQREFVADASHELRTPLTAISANLELLALSTEGEDREAAESARRSAKRMGRLVSDLLTLARMDSGASLEPSKVNVDAVVLEAIDELDPQIGEHEVNLELDAVSVMGSHDELVRIVVNLVSNALRHTPKQTEIRVKLRQPDKKAELVVEDDGPGIPQEKRADIFERFVRGAGESAGSTGLGLAIVQSVAKRHGGSVRYEPTHTDGTGARFVVVLGGVIKAEQESPPKGDSGDSDSTQTDTTTGRTIGRRFRRS